RSPQLAFTESGISAFARSARNSPDSTLAGTAPVSGRHESSHPRSHRDPEVPRDGNLGSLQRRPSFSSFPVPTHHHPAEVGEPSRGDSVVFFHGYRRFFCCNTDLGFSNVEESRSRSRKPDVPACAAWLLLRQLLFHHF